METEKITLRFTIEGMVQGVGFRYFVARQAELLNITGYARNNASGAVEVVGSGSESSLDTLKSMCQKGPSSANVTNIIIEKIEGENFTNFSVT